MKYLRSIGAWLVFSSTDPKQYSLFLKGTLVTFATYITVLAGFAHISVPNDLLTQIIDNIVAIVQDTLMLVSVIIATAGIIRNQTPPETV